MFLYLILTQMHPIILHYLLHDIFKILFKMLLFFCLPALSEFNNLKWQTDGLFFFIKVLFMLCSSVLRDESVAAHMR